MRVRLWGVRGSIPVPGAAAARYGGNTSCVQVSTDDGAELVLDAGSGIRELGTTLSGHCRPMHILLTHLHLDHIRGLMFFAPLFDPRAEITIWGPPAAGRALEARLARYISDPLSPIEVRDLPAKVSFKDALPGRWRIGGVEVKVALVAHRGPTLGYRLEARGASLAYLPDHEPGLGQNLATSNVAWISGHGLARDASLLIHDSQYTDEEYGAHRGWGHSSVADALSFARRAHPHCVQLSHHDPAHDDARLDAIGRDVVRRWEELGGECPIEMAQEGRTITLAGCPSPPEGRRGASRARPMDVIGNDDR